MSTSVKKLKAFDETSPQKVLFCYIKKTNHNNISKVPIVRTFYFLDQGISAVPTYEWLAHR